MTLYSTLFPAQALLISRVWFKQSGVTNTPVPAGAYFARAIALAAGGQGENIGGGAALAIAKFPVTPAENLYVRTGDTSTAGPNGDSFVKRLPDMTTLVYADRGRGNGTQGLSSLCIGDIRKSGSPGVLGAGVSTGGASANDYDRADGCGIGGRGQFIAWNDYEDIKPAANGGGGQSRAQYRNDGSFYYSAFPAGPGVVVIEYFDQDPG